MAAVTSLIAEVRRRGAVPDLMAACFDKQVDFLKDPSRRKALFVPRRSGKSWAVAVLLIMTLLASPDTKCLYYAKVKDVAWNILFKHMLKPICQRFGIRYRVNRTKQILEFENGSELLLTGDDATDDQIDKALGGKYKLVVFDECQVIKHDLEDWVKNKLGPAMIDLQGTFVLAGTAGVLMGERFWYRITREEEREPGWSVHEWSTFDNPYVADLVRAELDDRRKLYPDYDQEPGYQREFLNRWVVDRDERIYRYDPLRDGIDHHDFSGKLWRYVLGIDFGYEDATAFVVGAYHPHDKVCYILESFKKIHMDMDEVKERIDGYRHRFTLEQIVADGQNKQFIMSMGRRYSDAIRFAEKLGKAEHIAAMNTDFRTKKLRVIKSTNVELVKEWADLVWDEKARLRGLFKENPSKDNHLADAALYLHHACKHYWATPAPAPEDPRSMRIRAERELAQQLSQRGDAGAFYSEIERLG